MIGYRSESPLCCRQASLCVRFELMYARLEHLLNDEERPEQRVVSEDLHFFFSSPLNYRTPY